MYLTKCPILVLTDPGQLGKIFFLIPVSKSPISHSGKSWHEKLRVRVYFNLPPNRWSIYHLRWNSTLRSVNRPYTARSALAQACLTGVSQVDKQDFVTIFERCCTSVKNVAKIEATSIPTPTPASLSWGLQHGTPSESHMENPVFY